VLEAAVYGVPVMFGPKIQNSQEAIKLAEIGGGIVVNNKKQAYRNLRKLFSDDDYRKQAGQISANYVHTNIGATQKILDAIYKVI
jgi:3-deoxy-D-manno-octulosonic-acid transferase